MADELKNQPTASNNDQLLNLADRLVSSSQPMPNTGGFDDTKKPAAAPETAPAQKKEDVPTIRTLRSDISEYTQKSKTSYFDIVASTKNKPRLEEKWPMITRRGKLIVIIVFVAITLSASVGGYFWVANKRAEQAPPVARVPKPLIYGDNEQIIEYTGDAKMLAKNIQNVFIIPQLPNEFTNLAIKALANGSEIFFGPADLLATILAEPPANLESVIAPPLTFGVVDTFGKNEMVLMFKIVDYDRAFAGLLAWEQTIVRDLQLLLPAANDLTVDGKTFKDVIVKNNDARILENLEGRPILAYTIFNRKLVIIVSSKTALEVVLDKLSISPPSL